MQNSNFYAPQSSSIDKTAACVSEINVNAAGSTEEINSAASLPSVKKIQTSIQMQLALLLHAFKCQKKESLGVGKTNQCVLPNCSTMKRVLNHIDSCPAGKSCPERYCHSSIHLILHWKNCKQEGCDICGHLKQPSGSNGQIVSTVQRSQRGPIQICMQNNYSSLGLPFIVTGDKIHRNPVMQQKQRVIEIPMTDQAAFHSSQNLNYVLALQPYQQNIELSESKMTPTVRHNMRLSFPNANPRCLLTSNNVNYKETILNPTLLNSNNELTQLPITIPDKMFRGKLWHLSADKHIRRQSVQNIFDVFYNTVDGNTLSDPRIQTFIYYIGQLESHIYTHSKSRAHYNELIAKTMYKMRETICQIKSETVQLPHKEAEPSSKSCTLQFLPPVLRHGDNQQVMPLSNITDFSSFEYRDLDPNIIYERCNFLISNFIQYMNHIQANPFSNTILETEIPDPDCLLSTDQSPDGSTFQFLSPVSSNNVNQQSLFPSNITDATSFTYRDLDSKINI